MSDENKYLNKKRSRSSSRNKEVETTKKQRLDISDNLLKHIFNVDMNSKVQCSVCNKDITKLVKVVCKQCTNTVHCLDCLLLNQPETCHKHDYNIVSNLNFHLFSSDWTAAEELLLLTGII
jgi:hypothetical protein